MMALKAHVFDCEFVQLNVFTTCDSSSVRAEKILILNDIHNQNGLILNERFLFFLP